jgi:phage shock protein E
LPQPIVLLKLLKFRTKAKYSGGLILQVSRLSTSRANAPSSSSLVCATVVEMTSQFENATPASELLEISREDLQKRLATGASVVVDVLAPESYAAGHIPGAINIPVESIASGAPKLLPDRLAEIIVYCGKFT